MLKRWATFAPGSRMPDSIQELGADQLLQLQTSDTELFQLLSNSAPAELELAALSGELPDAAPTQQQRQDAAKQARIEAILEAGNPFGRAGYYTAEGEYVPPVPPSVTTAFELESLDPELAARLKAEATPAPAPSPQQQADAQIFARYAQQPAGVN